MSTKVISLFIALCLICSFYTCSNNENQNTNWYKTVLLFQGSGTNNWQQKWMLDGERSSVVNTNKGMELIAGSEQNNDTCHIMLWQNKVLRETYLLNTIALKLIVYNMEGFYGAVSENS